MGENGGGEPLMATPRIITRDMAAPNPLLSRTALTLPTETTFEHPNIQWPPDYGAEWARRAKLGKLLQDNSQARRAAMGFYKFNPVQWIEDWAVTFDPRNKPPAPRTMPFMLFPRQREFILFLHACYMSRNSGLVEKARDIGASWLSVAYSAWLWIFWEGSAVGWGSRKQEYVDMLGDTKAIFPKIRIILDKLPDWMLPEGYDRAKHATFMKIINPNNGSTITGEAGDNMGRGGRTSIYFKDESAHYERPEMIEAALGDNTDVQIDISSVNGTANVFYRRRMNGEEWAPGKQMTKGKVWVFVFDWRHHPAKTQEWYDLRRQTAEDEGLLPNFYQEVDRDYAGSVHGIIIPAAWVRAAIDAHKILPAKWGIPWPMEGKKMAMQDVADGGRDRNALVGRHGSVCDFAKAWGGEAGDAAEIAVPICAERGYTDLSYDSIGVGSGFKTQINTMKQRPNWPARLRVHAWNAGAPPLDPDRPSIPNDPESTKNKDQYGNLKAQSYFRLRARFYKTFKAVTKGERFPVSEMISISSDVEGLNQLVLELSQPVRKDNGDGKTIVDKKPDDASSPNYADAFNGCFNPNIKVSIFDSISGGA